MAETYLAEKETLIKSYQDKVREQQALMDELKIQMSQLQKKVDQVQATIDTQKESLTQVENQIKPLKWLTLDDGTYVTYDETSDVVVPGCNVVPIRLVVNFKVKATAMGRSKYRDELDIKTERAWVDPEDVNGLYEMEEEVKNLKKLGATRYFELYIENEELAMDLSWIQQLPETVLERVLQDTDVYRETIGEYLDEHATEFAEDSMFDGEWQYGDWDDDATAVGNEEANFMIFIPVTEEELISTGLTKEKLTEMAYQKQKAN